jgi:hypothetical protein
MTTTDPPVPAPFTNEDFAARMSWGACLESAATA